MKNCSDVTQTEVLDIPDFVEQFPGYTNIVFKYNVTEAKKKKIERRIFTASKKERKI